MEVPLIVTYLWFYHIKCNVLSHRNTCLNKAIHILLLPGLLHILSITCQLHILYHHIKSCSTGLKAGTHIPTRSLGVLSTQCRGPLSRE